MKQTSLSFLLALLLSMTGIKVLAHNIEVTNSDGVAIYYNYVNNRTELEVTFQGDGFLRIDGTYRGTVNIPESVIYEGETYPVTSIGERAFDRCFRLTSVTIPSSVKRIGFQAFSGCDLTSVTIPNSVTNIGEQAFSGCNLTSVTIPNSVTSIEDRTFFGCEHLTSIDIPNSVIHIGSLAFSDCFRLTSITFPNSIISVGNDAFYNTEWYNNQADGIVCVGKVVYKYKGTMPSNTILVLDEGTLGITDEAFSGCTGLKSISIPQSVTNVGFNAFDNTDWYNNQPDGLVYAGKVAYKYKGSMPSNTSVILEEGTLSISENAFSGYADLASITIPNSVTSIGGDAFSDCTGLQSVTIPNSVTSIMDGTFRNCTNMKSIVIPNSVTSIGWYAFSGCTSLMGITIPNSVITIGDDAFYNCSNLTNVTIGNSVTNVGWRAFSNCTSLKSIVIPNSMSCIGHYMFWGCSGLTNVLIPNSVTRIGWFAFSGCTSLMNITIPNTVINIEQAAFAHSGLKSITIPNSVTIIGNEAFTGCSNLTSVDMPNSLTSIGSSAFSSCGGLTSIVIPYSVTSIGSRAFDPTNLESIEVENGNSIYDSRDNCNAIIKTATNSLVLGCKNTIIPNSVTSIGYQAFYGCTGLTGIAFPNSVTSIEGSAFLGCSGLKSVTIPTSLASIEWGAFKDCTSLADVLVKTTTPLRIEQDCFLNSYATTLYVPKGCKDVYMTTDYWKEFNEIIESEHILSKDNYLESKGSSMPSGWDTATLNIGLDNLSTELTAYQFNLSLPNGFMLAKNNNGQFMVTLSDRYEDEEQSLCVTHLDNGNYHFECYSVSNGRITDKSGDLLSIILTVEKGVTIGAYEGYITEAFVSKTDDTKEWLRDLKLAFIVNERVKGDANGDSLLDEKDLTAITSQLINPSPIQSNLSALDVNGDGELDIQDVTFLINILLGR